MSIDYEFWVTETYIKIQERIARRLIGITIELEDSDRERHEVSLYGALSGLRSKLHERANGLRQNCNSLAGPSVLGSGQAKADRPGIRKNTERNRPSAQRNKGGGNRGRRGREKGTLSSIDKAAVRKTEYCIQKLRLIRRAVNVLGYNNVCQSGATIGVPSLDNKVNALGAARWSKIPWTRGTTNQMLRQRMGDALYDLCFASIPRVKEAAKELKYDKPLTWGKICIANRLNFALKKLGSWSWQH